MITAIISPARQLTGQQEAGGHLAAHTSKVKEVLLPI
jgi:hypothetical protein